MPRSLLGLASSVAVVWASLLCPQSVPAELDSEIWLPVPAPPALSAKAYILIVAETGRVLVEQQADTRLPPASLTKLMTSYVLSKYLTEGTVLDSDMVTVSEQAWAQNPLFRGSSRMFIEPSKPVSIADLHRGLVVSSGNDASVAIAEHLADTEEQFVELMNQYARALGMNDSRFANSHGLPAPQHYSSPRDLATLSMAIIANYPKQYALYKERSFKYNGIHQNNRNSLLRENLGVDGLKTGYTASAGYAMTSSARREGMRLVAVVMKAPSETARLRDTRRLLNYGYRHYENVWLLRRKRDQVLHRASVLGGDRQQLPLVAAKDILRTLPKGSTEHLRRELDVPAQVLAPLARGAQVGRVVVRVGDQQLVESPLLAAVAVRESPVWWERLWAPLQLRLLNWWQDA